MTVTTAKPMDVPRIDQTLRHLQAQLTLWHAGEKTRHSPVVIRQLMDELLDQRHKLTQA